MSAIYAGAVVALRLRAAVFDQLGYTASAGIACNKLLAKIVSARNKPNKQTVVLPRAVEALMQVCVCVWGGGFGLLGGLEAAQCTCGVSCVVAS